MVVEEVFKRGVNQARLAVRAAQSNGSTPADVLAILAYFVCCGVSRLARYNITAEALSSNESGKVKYFEGTPIPTSLLLVVVVAIAAWQGRIGDALWWGATDIGPWTLHPLALIYALSGSLMISKTLRIPKF